MKRMKRIYFLWMVLFTISFSVDDCVLAFFHSHLFHFEQTTDPEKNNSVTSVGVHHEEFVFLTHAFLQIEEPVIKTVHTCGPLSDYSSQYTFSLWLPPKVSSVLV